MKSMIPGFILCASSLGAQPVLTTGEVFNFNPGDLFQTYTYNVCGCMSIYYEQIDILTKTLYGSDSVMYTMRRSDWNPNGNYPWRIDTTSMTYYNLNSPVYLMRDSIIQEAHMNYDSCGNPKWECASINLPGPGETLDSVYSYAIKGCGSFSHYEIQGTSGCILHRELVYYRKDSVECGTPAVPPDYLNVQENYSTQIQIFPVPSKGNIAWTGTTEFVRYELWKPDGGLTEAGSIHDSSVDLLNPANGYYVLVLIDKHGNRYRNPLIITAE